MSQIGQKIKVLSDNVWRLFERAVTMLGGRTIGMLGISIVILILSVILSDSWITSLKRQGEYIGNVRTNIISLNQLKANLYKAESAQRGFLLTTRELYIEPFNRAISGARNNIKEIEALIILTSTGKLQIDGRDWLKAISSSLEAKAAEMEVTVNLTREGKLKEAKHVVNLDQGLFEMKRFIDYTDTVIESQNTILSIKEKERYSTISVARLSIVFGALLLIFLVGLVIKQLLAEIATKSESQQWVLKENVIYEDKLSQQTKLLRSLALDYQADVERERQKLSRELHDELGSIFTATKMDVAWVMKKLKDTTPETLGSEIINKLKKTSSYIDQGIQYQRHIVQELHPAMLSTFGFWPALTSLITDAAERNQWQLTLNLPDKNTKLNETISLVAYRIVQESLNNANKYAKATTVSVRMITDEKHLTVEIEDNGIGVDMNALDGNTHGLSGMRHRVLAIGGSFEMLSELGRGVLIRALIPLDISLL